MHSLPWWNPEAHAFYMSHRCAACYPQSFRETSERIDDWDEEAEKEFSSFLELWKIPSRFPEVSKDTPLQTARAVLQLLADSNGKVFLPVVLQSCDDGAAQIDKASDALARAMDEAEKELLSIESEHLRKYMAARLVLKRINAGEKGLHDPNNSGDKLILTMAAMDD